ncbi:zinc finger CCHC domain-containing protein 7-like [Betta splendens]|uniref:Zinc finger CCHC domain-containing protein 7 n=1 Tax=Betta splendens TaxID=158456 RepID=A0A6P7NPQ3_BETSP|nr:zinc finger CCHC domain-containing protein 7-like [Betta splendens]
MDSVLNSGDVSSREVDTEDEPFFVENYESSEGEESNREYHSDCQQVARFSRGRSPPLLLAYSVSCGPGLQDSSPSLASQEHDEEDEDSDQLIEEWMILGGDEQPGDSSIKLNLSYWISSEEDSGDEDPNVKSVKDMWAVSDKDKMCNRTGHITNRYYYHQKSSTCIFCGIQGHRHRDCPERSERMSRLLCGLPPLWNQHCQRCCMTGHLSDACPDTWRQYHLTIQSEVPHRPQTAHTYKQKRGRAHCYNCSKRGHYGFECTKKRMVSGTFPSLPYVCYYDNMEDILQQRTEIEKNAKGLGNVEALPPSDQHHFSESKEESGDKIQGSSRTKQEASNQTSKRKTWPVRRKERREVKRLRREAQVRRGGLLVKTQCNSEDDAYAADLFKYSLHNHGTSAPRVEKRRLEEANGRRSRKRKEAELWKKRGGMKRGDLYPHVDLDIGSENLLSPKQRVRHRRR